MLDLEAALVRELMRNWRELNDAFFRLALRPPVIRLVDSDAVLGQWTLEHRAIAISRSFATSAAWGDVIEVLKHEMAHQYAHEVLGAIDETAHGPAFRSVCKRMGIDPAATGSSGAHDGQRARVLERVARLLALAESPNRHESENAAALAQRLMLKHNIAASDHAGTRRYTVRFLGEPKGRIQESEHILAAILADYFFVEAIWVPGYRQRDQIRGNVLEISGTAENLEMAGYVHAFLSGTAERLWQQHKRECGITSNRDRRSYLAGVMEGFRERLKTERHRSTENGLVWIGDSDLSAFYRARHPHIRSVRLQGNGPSQARNHGRAAGRNIVLRRGVQQGSSAGGRALPPARG